MTDQMPVAGQEPQEPKAFTPPASQEEFDAIIEKRLARERAKFGDYEELKTAKDELEQLRQSQLSEQEKAVAAAREEGKAEATTSFERKLVSAEVKLVAASLGFHDAGDALAAFGDELPLKDGEPDSAAIQSKLDEIAKAKPYLIKSDRVPPAGKPKLPRGEQKPTQDGKGRAAAALRQLGAQRSR